MHAKPGSSEGPLLAAAPLEGTASVWLGTERSLLGDTPAADNGGRFIGIRSEGVKYWPHFLITCSVFFHSLRGNKVFLFCTVKRRMLAFLTQIAVLVTEMQNFLQMHSSN